MSSILITGAAGFIGFSVAKALLAGRGRPWRVVGVDDLNSYYSVALKERRLAELSKAGAFAFERIDVSDLPALSSVFARHKPEIVLHLAAQAGVRYSLENPLAYGRANLLGHLSVLEACRQASPRPRLVYASSSSVYGASAKAPFHETDEVDRPVSLYAATKRADELMSDTYAHLYGIEQIGIRFFTVYGPWGRPDMAYWTFTEKILSGEPLPVFDNGNQRRDFTYIDDAVAGVVKCLTGTPHFTGDRPHRIYNIGSNRPVQLLRFIELLEEAIGMPAVREMKPAMPGEVPDTCADISQIAADYGFAPSVPIEEGLPRFVSWYRQHLGSDGMRSSERGVRR